MCARSTGQVLVHRVPGTLFIRKRNFTSFNYDIKHRMGDELNENE